MHRILVSLWLAAAVASALAQVPAAQLAKPPANARHFVIQSTGGKHGDSWSWTAADGTRMGRESMNLRGQVFELDSSGKAGADGMPSTITIRGVTPQGDAAETFTIASGTATWKSPVDSGTRELFGSGVLRVAGRTDRHDGVVPGSAAGKARQSLDLLPGGKARAAKLTDLQVGAGAAEQTITLWSVTGISTSPLPIWADANNKFFGLTFGIAWLPEAYAGEQSKIEEAQATAMAAQAPGLAKAWSRYLRDPSRSLVSGSLTPTQRGFSPTRPSSSTRA